MALSKKRATPARSKAGASSQRGVPGPSKRGALSRADPIAVADELRWTGQHAGAINYLDLGLYLHARRLGTERARISRETGAKQDLVYALLGLIHAEIQLGLLDTARLTLTELAVLTHTLGDPYADSSFHGYRGFLALVEGDTGSAVRDYKRAVQIAHRAKLDREDVFLTRLASAHLENGEPGEALRATSRATLMHENQGYCRTDAFPAQEIWWRHAQALNARRQGMKAREALARAYELLVQSITSVRDEGLRRNCLNKVEVNREIVRAWIAEAKKQKLSQERLSAHLAVESDGREVRWLANAVLRLDVLRSSEEWPIALVEETTELTGGERVLLVVERDAKRELWQSRAPRGEDMSHYLPSLDGCLDRARRGRTTQLFHTPPRASPLAQRSRIAAPLIAQDRLLGYLYVDMDGLYGRFDETDRDMMERLATQAATAFHALQNARPLDETQGFSMVEAEHSAEEIDGMRAYGAEAARDVLIPSSRGSGRER